MKPTGFSPFFPEPNTAVSAKTVPADTEDLCQEQFFQEQRPGQNTSEPQRPGQGFGNKMVISTVY